MKNYTEVPTILFSEVREIENCTEEEVAERGISYEEMLDILDTRIGAEAFAPVDASPDRKALWVQVAQRYLEGRIADEGEEVSQ